MRKIGADDLIAQGATAEDLDNLPRTDVATLVPGTRRSQAQILTAIAERVEVFRAPDGDTAYATIEVDGHRETWPVRSRGFRRWLVGEFFRREQRPPSTQALTDALGVVEARAQFGERVYPVHVRVGAGESAIYMDLVDNAWEAVKITPEGWKIESNPPLKFRRARGMLTLPRPVEGGSLKELRQFVNVPDNDQWVLFISSLVSALRPTGPYPVVHFTGEHGAAKSTTQKVFRLLVDPNSSPGRGEPADVRDLMITALNGWIVSLDNISSLPPWLSDAICRLATGGGLATRELYTDADEVIFDAQRPVVLNGIDTIITRPDLLDRALIIELPQIPEECRRSELEFWATFERARPRLLGALLDAVVTALRRYPDVRLPALPRMADYALFATAAEPALGLEDGQFITIYSESRETIHELALESSLIAPAVRALTEQGDWQGTAKELLEALSGIADEATRRVKKWPRSPRALRNELGRIVPNLREVGVEVAFEDRPELGARRRQIRLRKRVRQDRSDRSNRSDEQPQASRGNDPNDQNGPAPMSSCDFEEIEL